MVENVGLLMVLVGYGRVAVLFIPKDFFGAVLICKNAIRRGTVGIR